MSDGRSEKTLSERMSGQYAVYMLKTMAALLVALTVIYWLGAYIMAADSCRQTAKWLETNDYSQGSYLSLDVGACLTEEEWHTSVLPQWRHGVLYLVCDMRGYTVIRSMQEYTTLYVVVFLALALVELIRLKIMHRQADRIGGKALRPISEIAATARRLSANNLSERVAVVGARDELLELTEVLNDMLDRIEAAYNSQKQFVSDASHELRTPISIIQGYADMLGRWGKTDPEVCEEAIAAIGSETQAMKELVEQLLFIARHDNRNHQYEMNCFDAGELMRELIRETHLIAGDHTVDEGTIESVIVRGDRSAVKQALRTFLDNALKYTAADGTITLSCVREKNRVRLTVADNGCGIAEKDLPRVFDRFYRTSEARGSEVDGHGLGLSIARIIVQAHRGQIEVQSKPGVGSRFHILLRL